MKNFTYLVYNTENNCALLIDPSWELDQYLQQINENKLTLSAILVTHHHLDHTNLAETLAKKYKCPVYMLQSEAEFYDFSCKNLKLIPDDADCLDIAGINVKIITTPGHTHGGVCYLIDNYLFSGDTLFIEGCGMCNTGGGDPIKMYHSLEKLKQLIPDATLVYPGHQYKHQIGKTFKHVKGMNIYLNFKSEADFVNFRMRKGQHGLLDFT